MVLIVELFYPSAPQRHSRYRLSLPWKAGSLITVQTAGCDADDCGTRGKLMHERVSHFRRKGPTEDAIGILTCAVHQILTRDKDMVFHFLLLILSNYFVKCF